MVSVGTGIEQASARREGRGILEDERRKTMGGSEDRCRKKTEAGGQMTGFLYRRQKPCVGAITGAKGQGQQPGCSEASNGT